MIRVRREGLIVPCPLCGNDMGVVVSNKTGKRFIGCSNYPECHNAYSIPQQGDVEITGTCKCGAPQINFYLPLDNPHRGRRRKQLKKRECVDGNCPH